MQDKAKVEELLKALKEQATTEIEVALINEFEQQIKKTFGEIWRDIKGHEGNYQISNYGRVKSFKGRKPRILSTCKDSKGYPKVTFTENGKMKTYLIHVLVARAFIPNPNNLPVVHHKDSNPKNNHVDNLEWVTYKKNSEYAYMSGRWKPPYKRKNCAK
ncbi:MAG: HNH endonuclease [Quinella sp. 1Q5]|nr:HNH endonuclease [Quinella sp. 1Q5]